MNETFVGKNVSYIKCNGLGSCVFIVLYDRFKKECGAAHILHPKDCDHYCKEILGGLIKNGSDIPGIRAYVIGGASLLDNINNIGERNVKGVMNFLSSNGIYVYKKDIGGNKGRLVSFCLESGSLEIKKL